MNRDNDDMFRSLLSNQRKLLMQIQQEISPNTAVPQHQLLAQNLPTRSNPSSNFITRATPGFPASSAQQYQVGNTSLSSSSGFQIADSAFQRPQQPLHYQQQQQLAQHHDVSRIYPSSQAPPVVQPPLPFQPMATARPQQQQPPSSTVAAPSSSIQNRRRIDSFLQDDHNDYLAGSLEPTPLRMKRLSLGLAPDVLNDMFLMEDPSKGGEKLAATNEKVHDHHSMHHDHSRIQVSDGIFDLDNDSPGDSSFSNIFQDLNKKDSKDDSKEEQNKQRTKDFLPPPPSEVRKDSSGGLTKKKKKRRREEHTKEHMSVPNDIIINKNRKINNDVQKFADALEKSAQSQQDIHQWDRKMGLKRSHSKTMTQSMQSRKKLRGILYSISDTIDHQKKEPSL